MINKEKRARIKFYKKTAVASVVLISALALVSAILPDKAESATEKRALAQFPEITIGRIVSGQFSDDFEDYLSDQFAGRDLFISLRSIYSALTGSDCSQDVYRGSDGYLIEKCEEPDEENLQETLYSINKFAADYDVPVSMILVPNASCILSDKLPLWAVSADEDAISGTVESGLSENINYLWLKNALTSVTDTQLYYRTDHHWTSEGALVSLPYVCSLLDVDVPSLTSRVLTEDFSGSLVSKSGFITGEKDTITAYEAPATVKVKNYSTMETTDSVISDEGLESSDPYTAFLGGNASRIDITTDAEGGKLLVFKDSYFNCLLPMLLSDYSEIVIVDPRYYYDDINLLMLEKNFDQVLFFYNCSTFAEDTSIKLIFSELPEADKGSEGNNAEPEPDAQETTISEESSAESPQEETTAETGSETETTQLPTESQDINTAAYIQYWSEQLSSGVPEFTDEQLAALRGALSDTVIVGDSMAQMLLDYGYLDETHVIYRRGYNITQLGEAVTEAAALMPDTVIFFTGLNDANHFLSGDDAADYASYTESYLARINELRALLPDVTIYVTSMLPPSAALGATRADLVRAPYFTEALRQMCEQNNVNYIDATWMCADQSLYLSDGIHFNASWNRIYLQLIAMYSKNFVLQ